REFAVHALGTRGASSMTVLSALRSPSESPAWTVRHAVALSLGKFGDTRALTILTELVADEGAQVRREAAAAIGRVGDEGGDAVRALAGALSDGDEGVRYWAAS